MKQIYLQNSLLMKMLRAFKILVFWEKILYFELPIDLET